MRPRLTPGIHILRRGDNRLQVGLDRRHAVVLPDTEPVRRAMGGLSLGELTSTADVPPEVHPLLGTAAKPEGRVAVAGFGHPCGAPMVERLRQLVGEAGLTHARSTPDVVVIAGVGEPSRDLVDPWVQLGTPHVLVRLVEGYAVVGPFVAPGRTACLRCGDAAATDLDPSWPLLVEQYSSLSARDRRDGATEPVDPALAALAGAWALRDVASYLQGHRPSTWSTTLTLDPLLADVRTETWLRHPACGCTWTMET